MKKVWMILALAVLCSFFLNAFGNETDETPLATRFQEPLPDDTAPTDSAAMDIVFSGMLEEQPGYSYGNMQKNIPSGNYTPHKLISNSTCDNAQISVYTDGENNYRIVWLDESGRSFYHFHSSDLDSRMLMQLDGKIGAFGID